MINFPSETDSDSGSSFQHLGCWGDEGNARAISGYNRLPPTSKYDDPTTDLIGDCYNYAKSLGWTVFAVQNQNECYTSADAHNTYDRYGLVDRVRCANGKGGFIVQDVYKILSLSPGKCKSTFQKRIMMTIEKEYMTIDNEI